MKIAVIGAGGVGGYFGARLAEAGHEVIFAARGAHRQAMAERGLRVLSANGDSHIDRPRLLDDPQDVEPCDAVLLCVKLWDLEAAARLIRPLVAEAGVVVPFQNGVEAAPMVADVLGAERILCGVAHIGAAIAQPGVIRHIGTMAHLAYGELDGTRSARLEAVHAAIAGAGIAAEASDDIKARLWQKFILLAPFAGATCYYRCPIGAVLADPERAACVAALVAETAAVGRASGVGLDDEAEARALENAAGLPYEMKTSMLTDLEAGRRLELPWLSGAVVRLGRVLGVATPRNRQILKTLTPLALGATGSGAGSPA